GSRLAVSVPMPNPRDIPSPSRSPPSPARLGPATADHEFRGRGLRNRMNARGRAADALPTPREVTFEAQERLAWSGNQQHWRRWLPPAWRWATRATIHTPACAGDPGCPCPHGDQTDMARKKIAL